jgi:hypothetical protein
MLSIKSLRFKRYWCHTQTALALVLALSLLMVLPPSVGVARITTDSADKSEKSAEKKVKTFKGAAVKRQVEKRRLKNKGLERAIREYARRGLSPRWDDSVIIQQVPEASAADKPKGLFQPASYHPQDETYTEGDTEITFITYSGDLNSWDGIVYVHTPYQDDTYSGDFLTPTDDGSNWDLINEVYYPPDGSTPCDGSRPCMDQGPVSKAAPGRKAKAAGESARLAHSGAKALRPGLWGWLKSWWGCTRFGCSVAWNYCPSNGYRFLCRVAGCVYAAFGCL